MKTFDPYPLIKKSEAAVFQPSSFTKIFYASSLLFWILFLRFEAGHLPNPAHLSWLACATASLTQHLSRQQWLRSWPVLLPLLMTASSFFCLAYEKRILADRLQNELQLIWRFLFFPLRRRVFRAGDLKQFWLIRSRTQMPCYRLMVEKSSGGKALLVKTSQKEKLKAFLQFAQTFLNLPVVKR